MSSEQLSVISYQLSVISYQLNFKIIVHLAVKTARQLLQVGKPAQRSGSATQTKFAVAADYKFLVHSD